jgi:flavin reductase (DIM6/NTAB) family NADH-FMN oxidoreductase RutF
MQKPWNRVDQPVYSLSTIGKTGANMNIATYVTPVSMKPKRYLCAVYHGTQTLVNLESNTRFVLQIMAQEQAALVRLLGKQSGKKIDKITRLEKKKLTTNWNGFTVLKDALAWIELQILEQMEGGDHRCYLCDVVAYRNNQEGNPLTVKYLGEQKIISI